MEGIRDCLRHARKVSSGNEKEAFKVVEDMETLLPSLYHSKTSRYLDLDWGERAFGQSFLSLAVRHGLTYYVRERAQTLALSFSPEPRNVQTLTKWPLLVDAIHTNPAEIRGEILDCLFGMGADPNFNIKTKNETPWLLILGMLGSQTSFQSLDKEDQAVLKKFLYHGADLKAGRRRYIEFFVNRFGSREVVASSKFSYAFFEELREFQPSRGKRKGLFGFLVKSRQ